MVAPRRNNDGWLTDARVDVEHDVRERSWFHGHLNGDAPWHRSARRFGADHVRAGIEIHAEGAGAVGVPRCDDLAVEIRSLNGSGPCLGARRSYLLDRARRSHLYRSLNARRA